MHPPALCAARRWLADRAQHGLDFETPLAQDAIPGDTRPGPDGLPVMVEPFPDLEVRLAGDVCMAGP
ncbi:MAG: hypothetical protein ACXVB2_25365, partial [Isosphaeraceae bacterium]